MKPLFPVFLFLTSLCSSFGFYPKDKSSPPLFGNNFQDPLFLSPLLEEGQVLSAQENARVPPLKAKVNSFSGYLTVDKAHNSNIFFWYFPREKGPVNEGPLLLWLQGGPGRSSMYALFDEIGPFYIKKHRGLKMRDHYWSQEISLLFMDSPVGTGFSFTRSEEGYSVDEEAVGRNLLSALTQFLALFPEVSRSPFYILGESYGAKFATALAYSIHRNSRSRVNLKGIIYGSGWLEPMFGYSTTLGCLGLVDARGKAKIERQEEKMKHLIKLKKWTEAFHVFDDLILGNEHPSLLYNLTQFKYYFNYLQSERDYNYGDLESYIQKDIFRRSVHVGNLTFFDENALVEERLKDDVMKSVKPWVEALLDGYKVLFYSGQLDILSAPPLTLKFIQSLEWGGAGEFRAAEREPWWVGGELAGYTRRAKGLTQVLVRNAGHLVPFDQPLWALDMITKFTSAKP